MQAPSSLDSNPNVDMPHCQSAVSPYSTPSRGHRQHPSIVQSIKVLERPGIEPGTIRYLDWTLYH